MSRHDLSRQNRAAHASALAALALLLVVALPGAAHGQWTTSGNTTSTTNNVGVGTNSPSANLDVQSAGGGDAGLKVYTSGAAGTDRSAWVSVTGAGQYGRAALHLTGHHWSVGSVNDNDFTAGLNLTDSETSKGFRLGLRPYTNSLNLFSDAVSGNGGVMTWTRSGQVGIGTASPSSPANFARVVHLRDQASASFVADANGSYRNEFGVSSSGGWVGTFDAIPLRLVTGSTERMRIDAAGNVGFGTANPRTAQEISYASGGSLPGVNYIGQTIHRSDAQSDAWGAGLALLAYQNRGAFLTAGGYGFAVSTYDGNTPTERLRVNATGLSVTGDISASGNISAKYQDVAEWVPSVQKLAAGTVVALDAERTNHVVASGKAYDTKVAGVVSAEPGVILGVGGEGKLKVATTGRVKVKVDATRGAIEVGDLLVTSDVEGVAMKSIPVDLGGVQIHRPGTIIGKALEPLDKGVGEILVLLSLQ